MGFAIHLLCACPNFCPVNILNVWKITGKALHLAELAVIERKHDKEQPWAIFLPATGGDTEFAFVATQV